MTPKERFVNALTFKRVDRVPCMEIALWPQTVARWIGEGAPPDLDNALILGNRYFGLDGYTAAPIDAIAPRPPFEARTLKETDESVLFTDQFGRMREGLKENGKYTSVCMDHYISFAVRDRPSFRDMRRRYEGATKERYPENWDECVRRMRQTDLPITLMDPLVGTFGYYSMLRNWFGTEPLSYMFYDDPALIHECLDFLTEFVIRTVSPALRDIRFDFYMVHEDLAGKGGPLIGPDLFREFFLPHYKRFVGFLKTHGVALVMVDTDGDFEVLIPLFLEAGVDGFGPMEVAAGMDPVVMRGKYGRSFSMLGGVDKREIARGRPAIDALLARLEPVIRQGGYIPTIDHSVPPDVPFANFQYYLERKRPLLAG
ncbi:MAG: uroporphyrinogen decarboxylase family protein [Kiritimatiellae bacterium]|nr:uroporphyrinogen decarboxylase family protein [Kiritimatiellia bacterium]